MIILGVIFSNNVDVEHRFCYRDSSICGEIAQVVERSFSAWLNNGSEFEFSLGREFFSPVLCYALACHKKSWYIIAMHAASVIQKTIEVSYGKLVT